MDNLGTGLVALAFWGFIATVVVAGIWSDIRKREIQHQTLRHIIDSDQPLDKAMMVKLLDGDKRMDRQLKAGGWVVVSVAPGLAFLGVLVSQLTAWALYPILGAAGLVFCIGVGLLVAASVVERSIREGNGSTLS